MSSSEKVIESFLTENEDKKVFTLHKIQEYTAHRSFSGTEEIPGAVRFETSQGHSVNQIDETTFEIIWIDDEIEKVKKI